MYPIPDIIQYAKISQYLCDIDNQKMGAMGDGVPDTRLPLMLFTERKTLEWLYEQDPNHADLTAIGNYVLSLCGKYLYKAMQTAITPGTPSVAAKDAHYELKFTVGEEDSPMIAGANKLTIGLPNIKRVLVFRDGGLLYPGLDANTQFSYEIETTAQHAEINFNEGVVDGYRFMIDVQYASNGYVSPVINAGELVYQEHASGSTVTINDNTDVLVINPAATLAALTITMPAAPVRHKEINIIGGGTLGQGNVVVTNLSIVPNTGQSILQSISPTQLFSGDGLTYWVYTLSQYRRK